jgi:hypothetical protein|tara:strand:+ start:477 stop:764 length:288 start_codon:yes stop_codon:yes gene_type:complete
MNRNDLIDLAKELINGDRAELYGDVKLNHERIASGWNIITQGAIKSHGHLTPAHITLMMDWVKTCRLLESIDHKDSWVDKIGYSGLGGEMATGEQ